MMMKLRHCWMINAEMPVECVPGELCPKCGVHYHVREDLPHEIPFCWECATSKTNADRGQLLLRQARMNLLGRFI